MEEASIFVHVAVNDICGKVSDQGAQGGKLCSFCCGEKQKAFGKKGTGIVAVKYFTTVALLEGCEQYWVTLTT